MQSSVRKDARPTSPTSSISNDWGRKSDKGETSKSGTEGNVGGGWLWGTTTTGGWDVDENVGWGGSRGEGGGRGGSLGDGWGGKSGDNASTVSNNDDQKGKRKEGQGEDVEMRYSSPPRISGSFKPISLSHNKRDPAPPPAPPVRNTPPSTVASKPARPPLPLPSTKKKFQLSEDVNLTKLALQRVKRPDKESEQDFVNPSEAQAQAKPTIYSTKPVHGPKGRADLFSQVLKHTSTVVLLQLELQRAQRDHARWKRTQESAQYERASHATRVILDHHRAQLNLRVQEAKRRLERALTALIELPDFASRNRKTPILTKTTIAAYTAELRDWISDLELHKRTLMEKAAAQADPPPAPVQGDSTTPVESQLTARQLVERGNWSWNEIKNATNELETRVLTAAEHLYSDVYTTIADLKDLAVSLQVPRQINSPSTKKNQMDAFFSTSNLVGDNLSAQAVRAAGLISKIHELEQEHEDLESERRAMDKLCAEAEAYFLQFEQWKQDDMAKLQEMADQLQKLHLRRKIPTMPTPTVPPAQLDGILLLMRPVVIDHLHKEVQPIFDALRGRCLENHEGMKGLIEKLVAPALVLTDDICHRVTAMSSSEASDFK
ncbi:hypothetical protein BYT27DRAFT_7190198 [Phlegmacium glaucopus]|nr:hypothetical protein BYT27DRAFT_7190198 [Phlegmacium glaucopus]